MRLCKLHHHQRLYHYKKEVNFYFVFDSRRGGEHSAFYVPFLSSIVSSSAFHNSWICVPSLNEIFCNAKQTLNRAKLFRMIDGTVRWDECCLTTLMWRQLLFSPKQSFIKSQSIEVNFCWWDALVRESISKVCISSRKKSFVERRRNVDKKCYSNAFSTFRESFQTKIKIIHKALTR